MDLALMTVLLSRSSTTEPNVSCTRKLFSFKLLCRQKTPSGGFCKRRTSSKRLALICLQLPKRSESLCLYHYQLSLSRLHLATGKARPCHVNRDFGASFKTCVWSNFLQFLPMNSIGSTQVLSHVAMDRSSRAYKARVDMSENGGII